MHAFFRFFFHRFFLLLQCCLYQIFCTINSYINSICGTIILIAAYSAIGRIFWRFSSNFRRSSTLSNRHLHRICRPFSRSSPSIFWPINTSNKFARWRHHSIYSLFSLQTRIYVHFFLEIFIRLNSSHPFARWCQRYICWLYSFLDEFLCVTLRFKNVPTQNPVLYSGPARVVAVGSDFGLHFR